MCSSTLSDFKLEQQIRSSFGRAPAGSNLVINTRLHPQGRWPEGPGPVLDPWNGIYDSRNVQNLVPKPNIFPKWTLFCSFSGPLKRHLWLPKRSKFGSKTGPWNVPKIGFHTQYLPKTVKMSNPLAVAPDRHTDTRTDAHRKFRLLHNRPFGQKHNALYFRTKIIPEGGVIWRGGKCLGL